MLSTDIYIIATIYSCQF